jgi:DNA-binding SARP family transcriptional activator
MLLTGSGNDAGLPVARVLTSLWPDSDGDSATHAFEMTVLRLRNQLGDWGRRALRVERGRVSLDPSLCWTDTAALSALLTEIGTLQPETVPPSDQLASCLAHAERLEGLYHGPFADEQDGASALAAYSERIRSKVAGAMRSLSSRLNKLGAASHADEFSSRLLDADPELRSVLGDLS